MTDSSFTVVSSLLLFGIYDPAYSSKHVPGLRSYRPAPIST